MGSALHGATVEEGNGSEAADQFAVEEQVLPDGEVLYQGQVLVDGLDAGFAGVLWGGQVQLGAVEGHGARVGTVDAADTPHEGGLSCTVVPDEGGDFARTCGQ